MSLADQLAAYSGWRQRLLAALGDFQAWLAGNELGDAPSRQRLGQLLDRLRDDRLSIAFVAEFSRGKSELINAIFFADYGGRMLPSSAGRTTMCPTELYYDPTRPPALELLPIETRAGRGSVGDFRGQPAAWTVLPLAVERPPAMQGTLQHVSQTLRVTPERAGELGFAVGHGIEDAYRIGPDGLVEIPRWRHALINLPHPLLKEGLVILDTPGLNAIGAEPELTLSLLPNAHAVLFVLAADTGVTQSDLNIWKEHVARGSTARRGRLVVLNKIDGQWDELKSPAQVDAEIARQAASCAAILGVPAGQVFPVSAQKGLVARVNGDAGLLARSRLPELEAALSGALIPARRELVGAAAGEDFAEIARRLRGVLEARHAGLREQLAELGELRGKNKGVVEYMMGKVRHEKEEFEAGLQRFYAVRSVFSGLSNKLFGHLGGEALGRLTEQTRATMLGAAFSKTLSDAIASFFASCAAAFAAADGESGEIHRMMQATYRKFSVEHGLQLEAPPALSLRRHADEVERLQGWCDEHLNSVFSLLTLDKKNITQKFFDEVAVQVRRAFGHANREAEAWLRGIMAPIETQIREHQLALKRRLDGIRRIHEATDSLEGRIAELTGSERDLLRQILDFDAVVDRVQAILAPPPRPAD